MNDYSSMSSSNKYWPLEGVTLRLAYSVVTMIHRLKNANYKWLQLRLGAHKMTMVVNLMRTMKSMVVSLVGTYSFIKDV